MSPNERKLPQFCYLCGNHRHGRVGRDPSEGAFTNNHGKHRWRCFDCAVRAGCSPLEEEVLATLRAGRRSYVHGFCLESWRYDFAFVHIRTLIEIDSWWYHRGFRKVIRDNIKGRVAGRHGWRLYRVRGSRHLGRRILGIVHLIEQGAMVLR